MQYQLYSAPKDFLTGCFTKPDFLPFLNRIKTASDEIKKPFSILVLDLDHFKSYNDNYGHACGDEILKYFSSTLRLCLSTEESYTFRFGGDEFAAVFPEKNAQEVFSIACQIETTIKNRLCLTQGRMIRISFSAGVAMYPADAASAEELLEYADQAMYFSKRNGRGRVTQFNRIGALRLRRFIPLLIIAIAGIFALLYLTHLNQVKRFFNTQTANIKSQAAKIKSMIPKQGQHQEKPVEKKTSPKASIPVSKLDTLYLKSGKICRGTITRDTPATVYLKMKTEFGGDMVIGFSKSEIDRIQ